MLSEKQKRLFNWWSEDYDSVIASGAIRSGKTYPMSTAYVMWAMSEFDNKDFIMAGQSVGSLERNVIITLLSILKNSKAIPFTVKHNVSKHFFDCWYQGKRNRFHCFGGADADSYAAIQGLTAAGALFDEAVLLNPEFVNQATARCSVEGAKFWFNCNPQGPLHWFKTEFIDKAKEKKALILHFKMEDNPSLSQKVLDDYKTRYKGVFYQRYIEGKWAAATGLIYENNWRVESFDYVRMMGKLDSYRRPKYNKAAGLDFGWNAPTACVAGLHDKETNTLYLYKEIYQRGLKLQGVCDAIKKAGFDKIRIAADSEDPRMIADLQDMGLNIYGVDKGKVLSGIQRVQALNIIIHPTLKDMIAEISGYAWQLDKKTGQSLDVPLKENDHLCDALRYMVISMGQGFAFG